MPEFITVNGKKLEYLCYGPSAKEAMTLIFLHEGLGSAELWRDFPQTLATATGCAALIYSRAGYGNSDPVSLPRPVSYLHHEALEVLPRILMHFDIRDCILIGHSDGGSIALLYAGMSEAQALRGVITEAAHVFNETMATDGIKEAVTRYQTGDLRERLAKYHQHVDIAFRGWSETWLSGAFESWTIEEMLPNIRVPTLVLQGEDDHYGSPSQVEAIAEGIGPLAQAVMLADCGHTPHLEQRERTLNLMQTFIQDLLAS